MSVGVETSFVLAIVAGFVMAGAVRAAMRACDRRERLPLARLPGWHL